MRFENEKCEAGIMRKARMMRSRSKLKQNQVGLFSITLFYPRAYVSPVSSVIAAACSAQSREVSRTYFANVAFSPAGFPVGGIRGKIIARFFLLNRPDFNLRAESGAIQKFT